MLETLSFPVALQDLPHPSVSGKSIPGRKAVVRTDTNEVLNIVSAKYPLITHADVFGSMHLAIQELGLPVSKVRESSANSGGYGKVIWTLDKSIVIPDHGVQDVINWEIIARNSYNYSSVVVLELGGRRQICTNGLTVSMIMRGARKRHVPSIKVPDLIKEIMAVLEKADSVQSRWEKWAAIEYPRNRLQMWLENKPIAKKGRQEILDYFEAQPDRAKNGGTPVYNSWEAYNSITWFATHRTSSRREDTRMIAEERLLDLAQVFVKEEIEASLASRQN